MGMSLVLQQLDILCWYSWETCAFYNRNREGGGGGTEGEEGLGGEEGGKTVALM